MKFKDTCLEFKDKEDCLLSVSSYLVNGRKKKSSEYAFIIDADLVGLSRAQARKFAMAILKETER